MTDLVFGSRSEFVSRSVQALDKLQEYTATRLYY